MCVAVFWWGGKGVFNDTLDRGDNHKADTDNALGGSRAGGIP